MTREKVRVEPKAYETAQEVASARVLVYKIVGEALARLESAKLAEPAYYIRQGGEIGHPCPVLAEEYAWQVVGVVWREHSGHWCFR